MEQKYIKSLQMSAVCSTPANEEDVKDSGKNIYLEENARDCFIPEQLGTVTRGFSSKHLEFESLSCYCHSLASQLLKGHLLSSLKTWSSSTLFPAWGGSGWFIHFLERAASRLSIGTCLWWDKSSPLYFSHTGRLDTAWNLLLKASGEKGILPYGSCCSCFQSKNPRQHIGCHTASLTSISQEVPQIQHMTSIAIHIFIRL